MSTSNKPDTREPRHQFPVIAIDPGKSGGIAWLDWTGTVDAAPLPASRTRMIDDVRDRVTVVRPHLALVEDVGYHRSGNSGGASAALARTVGQLESALQCCGVPVYWVPPKTWQRGVPFDRLPRGPGVRPPGKGGAFVCKADASPKHLPTVFQNLETPEDPEEARLERQRMKQKFERLRKNLIKELVQRQYPTIKVTLKTADALGILHWGVHSDRVKNSIEMQSYRELLNGRS